jgi:DNA-binding CsgD family transcriptional regulator
VQFISLYRPEGARPFSETERAVKEALVPHLMRAWETNWETNWDTAPAPGTAPPAALLSVDGTVIHADDRFTAALRAAWPGGGGKRLVMRDGGVEGPRGATAAVTITAVPGGAPGMRRVLLRAGGNGALTGRERAVAAHYADGLSYKEIAKALGITPDTVRSYIKTCYAKLAVRNKVQLQHALCRSGADAPAQGRTVSPRAPSM